MSAFSDVVTSSRIALRLNDCGIPEGSLAAARQFLAGRAQDLEVLGHVRGAL